MEVRNTGRFLVFTIILILAMGLIIYMFSKHPMGADFTRFKTLKANDVKNLESFVDQRVAISGKVEAENEKDLGGDLKRKDIIAFIKKRRDPTSRGPGHSTPVESGAIEFNIIVDGIKIPVNGPPQQILDSKNMIVSTQNANEYAETIRQGNEYSIFGTVQKNVEGKIVLVPYRVTAEDIDSVKAQAAKDNKKTSFIQYLSIFAVVVAYLLAIFKGNVFGPPAPEEKEEDVAESGEIKKNEEEKPIDGGNGN